MATLHTADEMTARLRAALAPAPAPEPSIDSISPDVRRLLEQAASVDGPLPVRGHYLTACGAILGGLVELVDGPEPVSPGATVRLTERGRAIAVELVARREMLHRALDAMLDIADRGGCASLELGPWGAVIDAMSGRDYKRFGTSREVARCGVRFEADEPHEAARALLDADERGEV